MAITKGTGGISPSIQTPPPASSDSGMTIDEAVAAITGAGQQETERQPDYPGYKPTLGQEFDWETKFRTDVVSYIEKWADDFGVNKFQLDAWARDNIDGAIRYIRDLGYAEDPRDRISTGRARPNMSIHEYGKLWNAGLRYFSMLSGLPFSLEVDKGSGSGRRGSSGPSGPTPEDIRNSFDLDQLESAVTNMWRTWLVEEPTNARQIASSYVEAIVATMGEQELDFETYVQNQMKKTSRYSQVYQNKPDGVTEMQFLQPFVQTASAIMGGSFGRKNEVSDVIAGGAALGASADAFRQRLARTDANRNSQGFITNLEDTMRGVSQVLRG